MAAQSAALPITRVELTATAIAVLRHAPPIIAERDGIGRHNEVAPSESEATAIAFRAPREAHAAFDRSSSVIF
jgi:hypothetical protein